MTRSRVDSSPFQSARLCRYYTFPLSVGSDMKRREFLGTLSAVAALPFAAQASQATNIPRLCFLTFDPAASRTTRFDAFFRGLRDLGYVDGKTITID
jgi:hypothetical protein